MVSRGGLSVSAQMSRSTFSPRSPALLCIVMRCTAFRAFGCFGIDCNVRIEVHWRGHPEVVEVADKGGKANTGGRNTTANRDRIDSEGGQGGRKM